MDIWGLSFVAVETRTNTCFFVLYGPKVVISDFQANLQSALSKNDGTFTWQKFINFEVSVRQKGVYLLYIRARKQ